MDSLTQLALGSAVGVAVMGRRTPVWKAALWGGVCGTLPDLDSFIQHGDPIRNMTFHRAESHALFYLTLVSPLIALAVTRVHREQQHFRRWWLAVWLALITHPLLDLMTVYGTQLGQPFTDYPFSVGSIFIIDPLYTVPILIGVIAALAAGKLRWNAAGLALSSVYLAWSVGAQQIATSVAQANLRAQGIPATNVLVTPTAFNTVLWRIVAMTPDSYYEGYYSLLDDKPKIDFDRHARNNVLYEQLRDDWSVARIAWFSHGFFKMGESADGTVWIADLRMGMEPVYTFTFVVAERNGTGVTPVKPRNDGLQFNVDRLRVWLWRRLLGEPIPPPHRINLAPARLDASPSLSGSSPR